jgi:hypothetical protein
MNDKHTQPEAAQQAELSDTALDEVVGGGVLLGDPNALVAEANQLIEHGAALVVNAGSTYATAAITYATAGAAAVEDRIERALGIGAAVPTRPRSF